MERISLNDLLGRMPNASATIRGGGQHSKIYGTVKFYNTPYGVMVVTGITGLPSSTEACNSDIFALHIHSGTACTGNEADPFANAGTHYNPTDCPHPQHKGDMPPLFSSDGYAFMAYLTNRFTIDEIIGKVVIIHDKADDFTSQPAGNSGNKIACGVIVK